MKLTLFVVTVLVLAAGTLADVCTENARCPPGYYDYMMPHYDCDKFFICENGIACEQDCPEGLHFNSYHKRCEAPELACCDIYLPCNPSETMM